MLRLKRELLLLVVASVSVLSLLAWTTPDSTPVTNSDFSAIQAADASAGKTLFKKVCAKCHSAKSQGIKRVDPLKPDAAVQPPDLSGYKAKGLTSGWVTKFLAKETKNKHGRKSFRRKEKHVRKCLRLTVEHASRMISNAQWLRSTLE